MNKRKDTQDKEDLAQRKAVRDFKRVEGRHAYRDKKAWDFNRLGKEEVIDTTRTMERKKK